MFPTTHMMILSSLFLEEFFCNIEKKSIDLVSYIEKLVLHGNNNVSHYILVSKIFRMLIPSLGSAVGSASVS